MRWFWLVAAVAAAVNGFVPGDQVARMTQYVPREEIPRAQPTAAPVLKRSLDFNLGRLLRSQVSSLESQRSSLGLRRSRLAEDPEFDDGGGDDEGPGPDEGTRISLSTPPGADTTITTAITPTPAPSGRQRLNFSKADVTNAGGRVEPVIFVGILGIFMGIFVGLA